MSQADDASSIADRASLSAVLEDPECTFLLDVFGAVRVPQLAKAWNERDVEKSRIQKTIRCRSPIVSTINKPKRGNAVCHLSSSQANRQTDHRPVDPPLAQCCPPSGDPDQAPPTPCPSPLFAPGIPPSASLRTPTQTRPCHITAPDFCAFGSQPTSRFTAITASTRSPNPIIFASFRRLLGGLDYLGTAHNTAGSTPRDAPVSHRRRYRHRLEVGISATQAGRT